MIEIHWLSLTGWLIGLGGIFLSAIITMAANRNKQPISDLQEIARNHEARIAHLERIDAAQEEKLTHIENLLSEVRSMLQQHLDTWRNKPQ
jgi:HAMP domain-containing protein